MIQIDSTLHENFLKVLQDHTADDPMRTEVKWTNLSRRQIAGRMAELGTRVGRDVVSHVASQTRVPQAKGIEEENDGPSSGSERPVREDRPSQEEVLERRVARHQHPGRKCAVRFKESMKIAFDKLLPKWNYRAVPQPT